MNQRTPFAALATICLLPSFALAQHALGNGGTMYIISGTCNKLVVGDKSYADCSPGLVSTQYPNRRVGFHFSTQIGLGVSFSGMDGENPTRNSDVSIIDKVIINRHAGGMEADSFDATGKCLYENPYAGIPAKVTCSGRLKDGRKFNAMFISDGSKPQ